MMDLTQKQWVKHSVFHPFEGFEDLRWKKGGSVLYASIVILLWFVAKILHDNLVGYQFAVTNTKMFSIVPYIVQTIAVFLVFVSITGMDFSCIGVHSSKRMASSASST